MSSSNAINKLYSVLTAGAVTLALVMGVNFSNLVLSDGQSAYADEGSDHGSKGAGGKGAGGKGAGGKGEGKGQGGKGGGHSADDILSDDGGSADHGNKGGGNKGGKKGDLYGDMYVILRDDNGEPILNADGFVQPIAEDGSLIPLDEDGHPIDESLAQEVEIGRLNVGRSPSHVLDRRLDEVLGLLDGATAVETDESGRLVITTDEGVKTIDSPLENLAVYLALMSDGKISVPTLPASISPELQALFSGSSNLTAADFAIAAGLLAAATDKYNTLGIDQIVYVNTFIGLNDPDYIDFSSFTTYDRQATYDVVVNALVQDPNDPNVYVITPVNLYEEVLGGVQFTDTNGGIDAFTQAADDARAVLAFIHDNVPDAE